MANFHCYFWKLPSLYHNLLYMQQVLRIQASIADADEDQMTGGQIQDFILTASSGTIVEIRRPSAPNATFTNIQTFNGANSLTLTYQYRIICSSGTCGSDCSQTTNCGSFPSCTPITCADSPCLNSGTCTDVSELQYIVTINHLHAMGPRTEKL